MKKICLILFCILALAARAQQGSLRGNIDTKNFPEVSFVWNEYSPDTLAANQFSVKENGIEVKFTSANLAVDSVPSKNKSILFLWEDQPVRKAQYDFTQSLLYYFFDEELANDTTTAFNIALFNRKQNDEPVLKAKLEQFTTDKEQLKKFMTETVIHDESHIVSYPQCSSLLSAIGEGLDLTGKEPKSNVRAIVVISAGYFLFGERLPVISQALQNKIPVYVIYYPAAKGDSDFLVKMAKDTYGQFIEADISDAESNYKITRRELLKILDNINRRHYGQDYKITFTSQLERDGNLYPLSINSNGTDYNLMPYKIPGFSLLVWAKAHWIWALILLVVLLGIVGTGGFFGYKYIWEKLSDIKEQKQEEERKKQQQQAAQQALQRKLAETQETLERQQKAAEQQKEQEQERLKEEQLSKLMHAKNLQPRLLTVRSGEIFNIGSVTTTIGRNDDNDITLADATVSKYHAQIVFNGEGFEICDLNSANGIFVNGQAVENIDLKSGDIIQLGEIIMKFL
jgi:pSer/pThr/pTyr-binding forkhead associated (FHA) protein